MTLLDTLTTAWTAATCIDDSNYVHTTFTSATTTATSSLGNPSVYLANQVTNDYVDSLSVEQLAEFDEMLSQKENELDLGNGQKVIIPEVKSQSSNKTLKKI